MTIELARAEIEGIVRLARETGEDYVTLSVNDLANWLTALRTTDREAVLEEREACAKVARDMAERWLNEGLLREAEGSVSFPYKSRGTAALEIEAAIRARTPSKPESE